MFKRYLAALLVMAHVLTFSAPASMAADGWVVTDANGNSVSNGNDVNVVGGNSYNVANGNIGVDQILNINIFNQGAGDRVIFNFANPAVWEGILNQMGGTAAYVGPITIAPTFVGNIDGSAIVTPFAIDPAKFFAGALEIARAEGQDTAAIINNGTFNLSKDNFLALIGSAAINNGTINANGGTVVLAAGDKVSLDLTNGSGLIKVAIDEAVSAPVFDANGNKIADAISNTGRINTDGGVAILSASALEGIFDSIINHTGIIEANSIDQQNGRILLDGGDKGIVSVTGTLNAMGNDLGETGGRIEVLGEKVGLFDGASINASGYSGGGQVNIGGGYQGLGELPHSAAVFMSKWADINVDATLEGNGGTVVLWSDKSTKAYGTISARGGILSGDGGLIETSSKGSIDVEGLGVDASAQSSTGKAGTWLIDPYNIEITAATTTNNTGSAAFTPTGDNSKVSAAQIQTQLNNGTAVTIATGGAGTGTQSGDITVNAAITRNSDNGTAATLTLNAFRDILINSAISATAGVVNVVLTAGRNLAISNTISTNGGSVTATATAGDITSSTAGDITTSGGALNFSGKLINLDGFINAGAGLLNLTATAGSITLSDALTTNNAKITLKATNDITLDNANSDVTTGGGAFEAVANTDNTGGGNFNASDAGVVISTSNGQVDISGDAVTTRAINSGSGLLNLTANKGTLAVKNALTTNNAKVTLKASNDINLDDANSDVTTNGAAFEARANTDNTGGGDFNASDAGSVINTSNGQVDISGDNVITRGIDSGNGQLNLNALNGDLKISGTLNTTQNLLLQATKDVDLNNAASDITTNGATYTVSAGDNYKQSNSGSSVTTSNGVVSVTAGKGADINGTINSGAAAISVTGNNGAVKIGNALTTNNRDITLTATGDVTLDTAAADINTNGGKFTATADSDNSGAGTFNKTNTASSVITNGGNITAEGASIDINGVFNAGTGKIDLTGKTSTVKVSNNLTTNGGDITLTAKTDVTLDNAASDISTSGGKLTVNADSDANGSGTFGMTNSGSSIATVSGDVSITANDFNTTGGTINSGTGTTFLKNSTAGKVYRVGGSTEAGTYNLSDAELDRITANVLEIGSSNAGNIKLESLQPANTSTVVLRTGSSIIEQTASAANEVTVANLGLVAGGSVDIDIDADKVAAQTTGTLKLDDSDDLTVDTVAGINGITTTNSNVTLGATTLGLAQNLNAGNGDVSLTATSGVINQTGGAITANDLSFNSTGAVTLNQTANSFDSVTGTAGGDINIKDSGKTAVEVKALTAVGKNINYFHDGGLTDVVTVSGNVTSGSGAVNGGNIDLKSSGLMTVDGDISSLIGSGGVITVTGATINGLLSNGAGNITLTALGALDTIINTPQVSATNFIINAVRDIILSSSITTTAGANVELNADSDNDGVGGFWMQNGGSIDSDGDVKLTGSSIFDGSAAGEGVRIDSGATITAKGNVDILNGSGAPSTSDIVINGNVATTGSGKTITVDAADRLTTSKDGAANLTGDNIDLTAGDDIDVEIDAKNLDLATTTGDITVEDFLDGFTLNNFSNPGSGVLTLITHSPMTIAADLIQAATINITATESVDVDDHVIVNNNITVQSTAGDVNIDAGDDVNLGTSSLVKSDTGLVNITAGSGDTDNIGSVNLSGDVEAATTLTLNALTTGGMVGLISQTAGAISAVDLVVNADDSASLNQAGNDVDTLAATTGGAVTIQDAGGLDLKASTIGGALDVTVGGNLTDSGTLSVTGATTLTAGANDITLDEAANDFSSVKVVSGKDVTINDANAINLDNSAISGFLTVTAGGLIDFVGNAATTVTGAMNLTGTSINDSNIGSLAVTGTSTLNTGAGNITLDNPNNDFSTVAVTAAGDVVLADTNGINIDNSAIAGFLSITAGGLVDFIGNAATTVGTTLDLAGTSIDDSGTGSLVVTGTTTVNSGSGNTTLNNTNNNFSTFTVNGGIDVVVNDTNAINLDNSTIGGFLTVTAGGLIDFIGSAATTVAGAMNLTTTTGGITDSGTGSVAVTGATTLDAAAANDITLNNTANDFSSVAVTAANNVTLNDTNAINLDNSAISGFLTVTAGGLIDFIGNAATTVAGAMNLTTTTGGITDSGATASVAVTGATTLDAGATAITLDNANEFSSVKVVAASSAEINDTTGNLDIEASSVTGNLKVTTAGALSDSGDILAGGLEFQAGTTVTLDQAGNDFDTIAGTSNGAITIKDTDSLDVTTVGAKNGIVSNNGTIDINVDNDLTLTKAVDSGSADVTLTAGGFIREGVADDGAPVADVIGKNIFLNSQVAAPGDAIGEALSYLDVEVTNTATGSWNVGVPNSGNVYVNCISDCPIGQVDVGTATFNFSTGGALLDGNDDVNGEFNGGVWNIKAGGINIKTGTGFGTDTDAIELRLSDFENNAGTDGRMAVDGGTGGVFATNAAQTGAGLTIGGIAGSFVSGITASTGITILSGSPLSIIADVVDNAGGDIFLAALGNTAADDVTITNANITASGGNGGISIVSGDSISVTGTSVISTVGTGEIELIAGEDATDMTQDQDGSATGSVNMAAGTSATTAGADILIDAALDVVVATANAGAGIATLLARAGSINGADATNLVTASSVDADAVTGIGNLVTLNTAASTINADTTNGNIDINNNLAGPVNAASLTTGTGTINFDQDGDGALTVTSATTTDGTITITNDNAAITATSVVAGGTGNANLTTTTAGDINLGNVDATGDTATINAAGGIRGVTDDATADVTAGTVNLTAASGGISGFAAGDSLDVTSTTALNADTTADNGLIMIDHIGNANLGLVNANTGTVIIDGTGTIDSVTNDGVADVVGGSVTLNSNGAIGGNSAVDFTATTSINANSNGNNIFLDSIGDAKVGLITAGAGNVTLNSTDKIDSVTDDGTADVVGATVNLNAQEDIGTNSVLDVTATTALNASTPGANITLDSIGNAIVGLITTGSIASGVVTLESTGAINSLNDDGNADIVAKTINLVALVGGIGTSSILEFTAGGATINADTTADNGNIFLDSIGDAIVGLITAGTGNVTMTSTAKIDSSSNDGVADIVGTNINLTATSIGTDSILDVTALGRFDATTAAANGNIFVDSIGNFPIGVVNAGLGNATLTSTGNMTDADHDLLSNVTAATINLTTFGSNIGESGSLNNYLDIQPSTLWNAATGGGDLYINCLGVCPTGLIDLGTGNGYLAVGTMTDGNDDLFGEFNSAAVNIIAGGFEIDSDAGIGTVTDAIEMRLGDFGGASGHGRFIADGGTGGIFATNDRVLPGTFGLELNTLPLGLLSTVTADGDMIIFSGSPMAVNINVTSGSDITLSALGAANTDDLDINNGIVVSSTGAGNIILTAGGAVLLRNNSLVSTTGAGTITAAAGEDFTDFTFDQDGHQNGDVRMTNNAAFRSEDGNILVDARRHSRISEVNADSDGDNTRGDVTVIARSGAISDRNGATVNITADDTVLRANTGIADSAVLDDNELETNTVTVDLINSTSGTVNVVEVAAGGNLDVLRANQNGAGNLNIRTDDGTMTVVSAGATPAGFGVSATSGITNLIVNDADNSANHDLVINNSVTSTTGRINLQSNSRDILADANGDVTASTGAEIEATAVRDIFMADGAVWNANAGGDGTANGGALGVGIDMVAQNGSVTLGSVQTTSTAATSRGDANNAVSISAANGAVIDGGDANVDIVANSGETKILAQSGIGNANSLEVQLDRLTADNIGAAPGGDIDIREVAAGGALNLVHVLQQAATDQINIQTLNGTLTVLTQGLAGAFTANGVQGLAGQIFLIANGGGANDDLVINNQIESTTGKINLDSTSRDVIADAEGDVIATGGAEIESAAQRHITMANGTVWNATSGGTGGDSGDLGVGIDMNANQNITLGLVRTTSEAQVAVDIASANGAIIDAAADGVDVDSENLDIITGNVTGRATLTAQDGIGSTNALETSIGQVDAVNGLPVLGSGNTRIREVVSGGDLDIIRSNQFALTGQNDIRTENGDLTVVDNNLGGLGVLSIGGQTFLLSQDSDASGNDHLIVNNTVQSVTGKINLDSMHDVQFSVEGDVTSGTGEIEVDATDFLTMSEDTGLNDLTTLFTGTGRIDLDAGLDITLSQVGTLSTLSNAIVAVSRNGRIIDAGDVDGGGVLGAFDIRTGAAAEDPTIFDGGLILSAFNGIGRRSDTFGGLESKVGQFSAHNVQNDIQLFNTGALRITTLTDPDATTSLGFAGVGIVPGVIVDSLANSIIFITAASPMEVNTAVLNNGGGNITLFSLGNLTTDTMTINADVRSTGANGNILITSGGTMTQANGTVVSTSGDGITAGLGNIIMAAGVDSTGALDVPSGAFPAVDLTRDGNATADLIMGETAAVRTEGGILGGGADPGNGTITMNAERNLLIAEVNADSNGDNLRGNVFTNSFTGDTLDSQLDGNGNAPILNITADVLTMFSAGIIGFPNDPIETNAQIINAFAFGGIAMDNIISTVVNIIAQNGNIQFRNNGTIFFGGIHANNGDNFISSTQSFIAVDNGNHITGNNIRLAAGGNIGTAGNPINLNLLRGDGQVQLNVNGQTDNVSAFITGNFTADQVQQLNTAPGLIFLNGVAIGGGNISQFDTAVADIFNESNRLNNPFVDYPGYGNLDRVAFGPTIGIDTSAIDTLPTLETLPPTVVPIPEEAETEEQRKARTAAPDTKQAAVPAVQGQNPPTVVPIPAEATGTLEPEVEQQNAR